MAKKKPKRDKKEIKYFMLVRQGLVQRCTQTIDGQQKKLWPLVQSIDDGKRLAAFLKAGPDVRVAEIGSVEGETLDGHIELAMNEGCYAAVCVLGWNADGSPKQGWILFNKH
jgi:hypothetical protein